MSVFYPNRTHLNNYVLFDTFTVDVIACLKWLGLTKSFEKSQGIVVCFLSNNYYHLKQLCFNTFTVDVIASLCPAQPLCVRPSNWDDANKFQWKWLVFVAPCIQGFLFCYLCVCLHSGRWCLLPGFASISSDLNDLGISFDMCRWNLQSSCDPWHWSFCSTCAAHLGSSPGLCSWCWDVLRTSCKLKLSNTVSDIKVGILQIYCKWYYANL